MVYPGCTRWALALVIIVLILALVATATVVMAGAVLQPKVIPVVKVQPEVVKPGDIVVVTGRGWPSLTNVVLVVALSPTRDLASENLLPVDAVTIAPDGRLAASFVFPAEVPWCALREAWVVVRPPVGNLQASARLIVHRARPTPTPTVMAATTPIAGRQQVQGAIAQLALPQGLVIMRPFDGTPNRGVAVTTASVRFADGRAASLADLQAGLSIAAFGWPNSAGTLLAEEIVILEATAPVAGVVQAPVAVCSPTAVAVAPVVVATACPVVVPVVIATPCPVVVPVVVATCTPVRICPPTPFPTPCPTTAGAERWVGEFFCNPSLSGLPAFVREAEVIDFYWRWGPPVSGMPRCGYSVRWTGLWTFPRTCRFRFRLLLRGAARLAVDGRLLLNLWDSPSAAEYQADADLAAGLHQLQLEFRDTGAPGRVQLRWEYAGAVP